MTNYPSYSVAIRTLGTAGERYLRTLQSADRQTMLAVSENGRKNATVKRPV